MDEITRSAKIEQFLNDKLMYESVMGVLRGVFTKKSKDRDAMVLASKFLALEALEDAERELERHRIVPKNDNRVEKQPGL